MLMPIIKNVEVLDNYQIKVTYENEKVKRL